MAKFVCAQATPLEDCNYPHVGRYGELRQREFYHWLCRGPF
jgi:hypothetical protein